MVGQYGTLTCDVSGADNLNPVITYQWTRSNGTILTPVGTNSDTLTFFNAKLSDAGEYTCTIIVSSLLLSNPVSAYDNHSVIIQSKFDQPKIL